MLSVIWFLPLLALNVATATFSVLQRILVWVQTKVGNNKVFEALGSFMVFILRINVPSPLSICPPSAEPQFVRSVFLSQHTFRTVGLCRKSFSPAS